MKKFTFILCALMLCLSVRANYYIVGDFNNWNAATAVEMTTTDGTNYTVQLDTLWGGFKITTARDWNHVDYGASSGSNLFSVGQTMSLVSKANGNNYNVNISGGYSNAVLSLSVSGSSHQITFVSGTTQYATYYIVGDFNNWDVSTAIEMTTTDGSNYYVQLDSLWGGFKITAARDWNHTNWGAEYEDEDVFGYYNRWMLKDNSHENYNINVDQLYTSVSLHFESIYDSRLYYDEDVDEYRSGYSYYIEFVSADPFVGMIFEDNTLYYKVTGLNPLTLAVNSYKHRDASADTAVIIPENITLHGYSAVVTSIADRAFYEDWYSEYWDKLKSVSIPNTITSIGRGAFKYCTALTTITIPESVISIGDEAFDGCINLSSVTWNAIRCYMPSRYSDAPFYNCNNITSFVFGNNVQKIPENLCYNMSGITSITIPNSVTYIGGNAFHGCTNAFTSLVINENVDTIGPGAFGGCNNITLVIWNARNCANVSSYSNWNSQMQQYEYSYYDDTSSPFPSTIQTFIFGDNVQKVPSGLCSGLNQLTSIALPNMVRTIGNSAFYRCSGLISFTMENGVQTIGNDAFSYCSNLPQIVMPNTVTKIGYSAFNSCKNLTTAIVGNSVDTIGGEAFYECERLISIELPATVTELGDYAFIGCSAMNKAIIHSTVQFNPNCFLMYNAQLDTVIVPASLFDIAETNWVRTTKKMKYLRINSGELTENGLAVIRRSASTLETLDVAATTNTTMADEAFSNMYNLTTLALPQNLERISYMAVAGCKMLPSISIPATVTEIGTSAFEHCRSLQTVTFDGNNLTTIGNWAFYNNHALQQLTIPAGVTTIGAGAFYGCTYLEDLAMPASLRNVGDNAFALCNHLTKMQVEADLPPMVAARTFFDVSRNIPVYVPDEAVNDYRNTAIWQEFFIRPISQAATGIETVRESDSDSQNEMLPDGKFFQNGKLLIRRNGKTYDITGSLID